MDEEALVEIGRQMAITNRLTLAREYLKAGYYDTDEYIDELREIEDDLR